MNKNVLGRRIAACFMLMVVLLFICIVRIYQINTENYAAVQQQTNSYSIKVGTLRKTIFDRNLQPITNKSVHTVAAFPATARAIEIANRFLEGDKKEYVLSLLNQGKPATVTVEDPIDMDGVSCFTVYEHNNSSLLCPQLIGYLNNEEHGVSGIEAAFDSELYTDQSQKILFPTNGLGSSLVGAQPEYVGDVSVTNSGIALTLDTNIQLITAEAIKNIPCGAAVVSEVGTGKILAMASTPEMNIENLEESLNNPDSPLINRALTAYNIGSAFKPCIAAAVLEQNKFSSFNYLCNGVCEIAGHSFRCHNPSGHGNLNIAGALMYSCNTFFYNIVQKTGADVLYKMASSLNFGQSINLGGVSTASGSLTSIETLANSPTALANFAIGQGELLLSPVSVLPLYEAIANGGIYHLPTVIEGRVEDGKLTRNATSVPTRVMSKNTADKLKEYLKLVVTDGTGTKAAPTLCTAAGKTATAETGWVKNGTTVQNSWFCGFFPAENPKYVVVVLVEDEETAGISGAPVFKEIADGVCSIYPSSIS